MAKIGSGNSVATKSSVSTYSSIRATAGKSTGKRMFRVQLLHPTTLPGEVLIGIAKSTQSLSGSLGDSTGSYGYDSVDGKVYFNNAWTGDSPGVILGGTWVDVYVDFTTHNFYLDRNESGSPYGPISFAASTYFPAATVTTTAGPDAVQIDTGTITTWGSANGYSLWGS